MRGEPQRQPGVARDGVSAAVARAVAAGVQLEAAAAAVVLEQKVQHPGDGVGAVLGRRAVAQHLDLPQRDRRDGRDVGALRSVGDAVADPGDDRAPVPALAVDQHERVVWGEAAQVGWSDESSRVPDGLGVDVVGRDQGPQLIADVGAALADDVLERDGVDRHRRLDDRSRLGAAADDDHPLLDQHRHLHVEGNRRPGGHFHGVACDRREPGHRERHVVRTGCQRGEREPAAGVGYDGPRRIVNGRAPRLHRDAGQDEARRVRDRAGQNPVRGATSTVVPSALQVLRVVPALFAVLPGQGAGCGFAARYRRKVHEGDQDQCEGHRKGAAHKRRPDHLHARAPVHSVTPPSPICFSNA